MIRTIHNVLKLYGLVQFIQRELSLAEGAGDVPESQTSPCPLPVSRVC